MKSLAVLLRKKKRKIIKKYEHTMACVRKHTESREALLRFIFKRYILPLRIFFGIGGIRPYAMDLKILFESDDYIVLDKPAHMLTHPSRFNEKNTLLNGILFHRNMQGNVHENMPGPISRLDRDTSGIVLFALSKHAKSELGILMMNRGYTKKYIALVSGKTEDSGEIIAPLARHPELRSRMRIDEQGKMGHTQYERLEYFAHENVSLVSVTLLTGRMHQIRVHFSHIEHPVVGDTVYGIQAINDHFRNTYHLHRQFLHATTLEFSSRHFVNQSFISPLPKELEEIVQILHQMQ